MRPMLLFAWLLLGAVSGAAAAERWLTLTEGSELSVSTSADGSLLSIDLAGRIWVLEAERGKARALTAGSQPARRPAVSPDGRYIAFEQAIAGRQQIAIVPSAGGLPRQVTFGDYDHLSPVWHPSGERLLLASNRGGSFDIWELQWPELDLRQLTFAPGDERDPAWDASGTRLVFVGHTADGADGLFLRDADGRQQLLLADTDRLHGPVWRQDDGLIAYVRRSAGHGELRLLLLSEPPVSKRLTRGENVFASRPAWQGPQQLIYTADGHIRRRHLDRFAADDVPFSARVAIPAAEPRAPSRPAAVQWPQPARRIDGLDAADDRWFVAALGAIWELDAAGEVRRQLGQAGAVDRRPALAPDHRRLAWVSDATGLPRIWILDLDTNRARPLSPDGLLASTPAWQPDGLAVAYLATTGDIDRPDILLQAVDGSEPVRLAHGLWQLTGVRWVAADRLRLSRGGGLPDLLLQLPDAMPTVASDGLRQACGPLDQRWLAGLDAAGQLRLRRADGEPESPILDEPVEDFGCTADGRLWYRAAGSLWQLRPLEGAAAGHQPLSLQWRPAVYDGRLVIRVGRVFDGLGPGYVEQRDLVIEDGRIATIRPWQDPPPPGRFVDARELTALPGLIDLGARPLPVLLADEGRAWLDAGITTVRFSGAEQRAVDARAESWLSAALPGPRVFLAGSACSATATTPGVPLAGIQLCHRGDVDLAAQVDRAHQAGQPAIALRAFPSLLLPIDELWLGAGPSGIYGDIIELAAARGLRLASRLTTVLRPAAPPDWGRELADRYQAEWPPAVRASWWTQVPASRPALRARAQALFRAVGRGARVMAVADGERWPPGLGLRAELRALQAAGLQPFEVLRMATRDAASALGRAGELGELRPGAAADLLLVHGDPLRQVDDAARPVTVLLGGRVYQPSR